MSQFLICIGEGSAVDHMGSYDGKYDKVQSGDPGKRAFTYFMLGSGRFVYASVARLAVLKFVSSMSASADVLALASVEFDLSKVDEGTTVTIKWRGKPIFVRHRTSVTLCSIRSL